MDRLSILLTLMTGSVLTGGLVITAFSLDHYDWSTIIGAVVIGYVLSWPAAYLISRWIKRNDPGWDHTRKDRTDAIPRSGDPEV